ncbi:hypothetical protein BOTBODRAFT_517918 [Botryobasidium botryosum FD-172 SS1]|uniref:Uncharacterized protein n=1 Tax=Botryobasidium botryosum (strain FD-172 SS1) TaxID=930990 RepID=A0A067MSD9_BOTB1|nr:hypothetical protein BOTBODRAFT_517918 [Botryobasidium botryosum FD-172 SS1]
MRPHASLLAVARSPSTLVDDSPALALHQAALCMASVLLGILWMLSFLSQSSGTALKVSTPRLLSNGRCVGVLSCVQNRQITCDKRSLPTFIYKLVLC